MTTPLVVNNITYNYPQNGDEEWGVEATNWAAAVTSTMLQKTGGLFTLSAEVDFGSSYGLRSLYYKDRSTNPATAGQIRLGNTSCISWRNAANTGNISLCVGADDKLDFNGIELVDVSSVQFLSNKTLQNTSFIGTIGGIDIDDLDDVNTSGVVTGQTLTYNGSTWVPAAAGAGTIIALSDTPNSYSGEGLKVLRVNAAETGVEFATDVTSILLLTDTPSSYSGQANKFLRVNAGETAMEFVSSTSAGPLDDLTDVVLTSPTAADYLRYNGTNWVNSTINSDVNTIIGATSVDDLSDVDTSGASTNDLLQFNGINWVATDPASIDGIEDDRIATRNASFLAEPTITAGVNDQIAIGYGSTTDGSGTGQVAVGISAAVTGILGTSVGLNANAGARATSIGGNSDATGDWSTAVGEVAQATGTYSTAIGRASDAPSDFSTALGYVSDANGDRTIALGANTTASDTGDTAVGYDATSSRAGGGGTAVGRNAEVTSGGVIALGEDAYADGSTYKIFVGDGGGPTHAATKLFFGLNGKNNFVVGDADNKPMIVMPNYTFSGDQPVLADSDEGGIVWDTTSGVLKVWNGSSFDQISSTVDVLDDLSDVTITGTPADNELLAYDSGSGDWINQTAAEAGLATAASLVNYVPTSRTITAGTGLSGGGDLSSDRTINLDIDGLISESVVDGSTDYVAVYDASPGATRKVLIDNLISGSISLSGLSDTTITSVATGELLKWDGTAWINNTLAEAGLEPTLSANEKIDHSTISITAGTGLSGGGTIDSNVTIATDFNEFGVITSGSVDEANDYAVIYDNSASGQKKITVSQFLSLAPGQVSSVFGRTGAVTAQTSDYDASQIDNDSDVDGATVAAALQEVRDTAVAMAVAFGGI